MILRLLLPDECEIAATLTLSAPSAAQWTAADYRRIADVRLPDAGGPGHPAFCLVAVTHADQATERTPESAAGELTGLLVASRAGDEGEIQNLVVLEGRRRRGIARALLDEAMRRLAAAGVRNVFLEVRERNTSAVRFYEKHGFRLAGRRRGYYQNPPEDALVYSRPAGE